MRLCVALFSLAVVVLACECQQSTRPGHSATADRLFPFEKDDAVGFINARGKVVIRPKLASVEIRFNTFDSGRLLLDIHGAVVFLDTQGREVIRRSDLASAFEFQDGLAAALSKDAGLWGFLATDGSFAIPPQFAEADDTNIGHFSEGLAAVQIGGQAGYIDKRGQWAIPRQFAKGYEFHEDFAVVIPSGPCHYFPPEICCTYLGVAPNSPRLSLKGTPECGFALIERDGRRTHAHTFAYLQRVSEGLAAFRDGAKWGFINTRGEIVIPAGFDNVEPFSEGRALVRVGKMYGFIDREGTMVIPARYPSAGSFSSGLAPVEDINGTGWEGYIDRNGNVAIREEFNHADEFRNGLALVQLLPKDHKFGEANASIVPYDEYYRWAYIDRRGKHVFEFNE